jgi:hypothetical protein
MDLPGPFGSRDIGRVVVWVLASSVAAGCMGSDPGNDRLAGVPPGAQVSTLTGRLWILDEAGNCTSTISNFFPCLLANTSFNRLTSAFSNGESLSWGGIVTGNAGSSFAANQYCTSSTTWQVELQRAETFAKFALQNNDVILVIQPDSTQWACNDSRSYAVKLPDGTFRNVRGAFVGGSSAKYINGGSRACGAQTTLGLHEVYEAASDGISADCCLGESICAAGPVLASLTCGVTTYDVQKVSPSGTDSDKSKCTAIAMTCVPSETDAYYCAVDTRQYGQETCGHSNWVNDCGTYVDCGSCPNGSSCNGSGFCVPGGPTCPVGSCGYRYGFCGIGAYCGSSGVANSSPNTLYQCNSQGGPASVINTCGGYQCIFRPGLDDVCAFGPTTCPVKGNGWYGAGLYCGRAQGMGYAEPYVVYYCGAPGGLATVNQTCTNNCVVAANGYNDHC